MTGHRDKYSIGIARIDGDLRDLLTVAQPEVRPGFARVRRLVDSVAHGQIRTMQAFTAADVDHVRIRNRNRHRSDGTGRLVVEDRLPGSAVVGRLEDTAIDLRDVKYIRLRRNSRHRPGSTAAERSDIAPMQSLLEILR